jgi:hypothetical protein
LEFQHGYPENYVPSDQSRRSATAVGKKASQFVDAQIINNEEHINQRQIGLPQVR